ncbi:MAG TPA: aldolase/citrate lyase family protein [Pseudolabrys sp.]|nr:aldolase/citrate lyase family protein [Pseudolabrys sp.]
MAYTNRMRERLARGEVALCMATRLARTADIGMIADSCGFDAFFIDMEHCTISLDAAAQICVAALPVGITPMVRIAGHQFEEATRLLDMGALGIICPNVSTRAEAEAFVQACCFPPLGKRSVAGAGPLQGYRQTPLGEVNKQGNASTTLIAMLETPEGIANADAIAAVDGVDMLLIGSNDLCTAMGIPGDLKSPKLRTAYEAAATACRTHNKHLGVGGIRGDVGHIAELVKLGARFVIAGSDVQYLMRSARAEVESLRRTGG